MAITYYITARQQLAPSTHVPPGDAAGGEVQEQALKERVRAAFSAGVDYVQVREKDLPARRLALLIEDMASCPNKKNSRLLVNERIDVAVACGADGVHLPSGSLPASVARQVAAKDLILGVSCHNEEEAAKAAAEGACYILLAPIFETPWKAGAKPLGLSVLEKVCRRLPAPVFALGGVDARNAQDCIRAGASGVAGIRLFQEASDLEQLCRRLRALNYLATETPRHRGGKF